MELIEPIHAKNKLGFNGGPTSVIFSLKIIQVKCIIINEDFFLCFMTYAIYFVFIIVH